MLKTIYLNHKKIPVPIPLRDLREALEWVEKDLLSADRMITRITLNGENLDDLLENRGQAHQALGPESRLELRIDSARELITQSLEVLKNLIQVAEKPLKAVAVMLWEYEGAKAPAPLNQVFEDWNLLMSLFEQLLALLSDSEKAELLPHLEGLYSVEAELSELSQAKNWKGVARELLNRYEAALMTLSLRIAECQGAWNQPPPSSISPLRLAHR